jgi:hypothetical protein
MPDTLDGMKVYRDELKDGLCALQSLDDLGSEGANQAAWNDMLELQRRHDLVEARIKELQSSVVIRSERPDSRTGANINTKELLTSNQTSGIEPVYQDSYTRQRPEKP